jgi:hypothetical protein
MSSILFGAKRWEGKTYHKKGRGEVDYGEPGEHADVFVLLHAQDRGDLQDLIVSFGFAHVAAGVPTYTFPKLRPLINPLLDRAVRILQPAVALVKFFLYLLDRAYHVLVSIRGSLGARFVSQPD